MVRRVAKLCQANGDAITFTNANFLAAPILLDFAFSDETWSTRFAFSSPYSLAPQ